MSKRQKFKKIPSDTDTVSNDQSSRIALVLSSIALGFAIVGTVLGIVSISTKVSKHENCFSDSDCSDGNVCTIDICQANGECEYATISGCNPTPFSVPERTLYVSPQWIPSNFNSSYYFTTISAALLQASTYTRTFTSPVTIIVNEGIYNESVSLIPNIVISGVTGQFETGLFNIEIIGTNFHYIDATSHLEVGIFISNVVISVTNITIDFTNRSGADGSMTIVNFDNCQLAANSMTYHTRPTAPVGVDLLYITSSNVEGFTATGTGAVSLEFSTFFPGSVILQNTMTLFIINCDLFGPGFQLTSSTVDMYNTYCEGCIITTSSSSSFFGYNSILDGGSVTVNSGTSVDLRSSQLNSVVFSGAGTLARSLVIAQNVSSVQGINTFNLSPPYPSTAYNVMWSQVGGVNNQAIKFTSKTASAFQWNDTAGGDYYDFTILMP